MAKSFNDYRGVRDFRGAFNVQDTVDGYSADTWEDLEGTESINVEGSESYAERYRDNKAVGGVATEGPTTITAVMDVLARKMRAKIEGRTYVESLDMIVGTKKKRVVMAASFIGKLTDGTEELNIYYNCMPTGGNRSHTTENDGTDVSTVEYQLNAAYTKFKCNCGNGKDESFYYVCVPLTDKVTEEMILGEFTNGKSTKAPLTPEEIIALGGTVTTE